MNEPPKPSYDDAPQQTYTKENGDNFANSQGYDITSLLVFAEELKRNCDSYAEQIETLVYKQDFTTLNGIVIFFSYLFLSFSLLKSDFFREIKVSFWFNPILFGVIPLTLILTALISYLKLQSTINIIMKKIYVEATALEKTVDLLREIGNVMVYRKEWDQLKTIELQIRLSRFSIGKYRPSRSILSYFLPFSSKKIY